MTFSRTSPFLRLTLLADAVATAATGLLMTLLAGALEDLLQVPAKLLFYSGCALLPYSAIVAYLSTREVLPRWAVFAVIVTNALWAADCVLLMFSGWIAPSALGYALILAQVLVVVAFAELQYVGLRRLPPIHAVGSR
jgi:hypothetical protein